VLDRIYGRPQVRDCARVLVRHIMDELKYRRFREKAPALFEYKMRTFQTSSYVHMARSMNAAMRIARDSAGHPLDTSDLEISREHQLRLGYKLIDLLIESTT